MNILCCTSFIMDKIEGMSFKLGNEQVRRCKLILYKHTVSATVLFIICVQELL